MYWLPNLYYELPQRSMNQIKVILQKAEFLLLQTKVEPIPLPY